MPKDYYLILGISRGADLNQIKKAYRRIAKACHPDVSHEVNDQQFREIQEAYETLADGEKRRVYDDKLEKTNPVHRRPTSSASPYRRTSIFSNLDRHRSLLDEFFDGLVPGIYTKERNRAPQKSLYYEIFLSPHEANNGGLFPIRIPVIETCSACGGSGWFDGFYCPQCNGYGRIDSEREFSISIPPNTAHGTQVSLSLEDIGLLEVQLHLVIYVDPTLNPY